MTILDSFGTYWARRINRYLRRRNFWDRLGILGAHYCGNDGLIITADGFVQLKFRLFENGFISLYQNSPNGIIESKLCIPQYKNINFLTVQNLLEKFQLLDKMEKYYDE